MSTAVDVVFEDGRREPRRVRASQGVVFENCEPGCPIDAATMEVIAHHVWRDGSCDLRGWRICTDAVGTPLWTRMYLLPSVVS